VSVVGSVMRSHSGRRGLVDEAGDAVASAAGGFDSVKAMTGTRYTFFKKLKMQN
jgi:hypothetical protein